MIAVEGRVLPGLDEFMLRLGHLKLLCRVVATDGGSWRKINQTTASILQKPIRVDNSTHSSVADYLFRKHLCPVISDSSREERNKKGYRYPDIVLALEDQTPAKFHSFREYGTYSHIWWQDYCLADPQVRSTVGAITSEARSGSKTGLSHICDWAISLDLVAKNGQLLPFGKLIAKPDLTNRTELEFNPYLLGTETLVLAYAYLAQDMDIFSRLIQRILDADQPLTPPICSRLFVETLEQVIRDGENSKHVSAGELHKVYLQLRDLEKAARRSRKDVASTSTAWHRAASRFETYADLGFLDKVRDKKEERFKYVYYINDRTRLAAATLNDSISYREWVDEHLSEILFSRRSDEQHLAETDLLAILSRVVKLLSFPTRLLPIDAVILGVVREATEQGVFLAIGSARNSIEALAKARSDIARLSRGTRGAKAEFVSLNLHGIKP